jgi:lipoprotein-anchoring transpeptidase ErfK/SrfK
MRATPLLSAALLLAATTAACGTEQPIPVKPVAVAVTQPVAQAAAVAAAPLKIIDITPRQGETVGIGMPIIVKFNQSVRNRKAAERNMLVKSTKPTVGAWYWKDRKTAIFRTKKYWPARQTVTFSVGDTPRRSFKIGNAHYIRGSAKGHWIKAYQNGKLIKKWPVSMGKGGNIRKSDGVDVYITTSGKHLVMDHKKVETMTPPGVSPDDKDNWYKIKVPWATRISESGEYIHTSMEQAYCLGKSNCSHGCVRSPEAAAKWFMYWSYRGDVVDIRGTKRPLHPFNGWGYHQLSWSQWVAGGALKAPVTTG